MYVVRLSEDGSYIKSFDYAGYSLTRDHRFAFRFDTELAAWLFLHLVSDQSCLDFDDLFVEFLDFKEVN